MHFPLLRKGVEAGHGLVGKGLSRNFALKISKSENFLLE